MKEADLKRLQAVLLAQKARLTKEINHLADVVLADERPPGEHDSLTSEPVDKEVILDNTEEAMRQQVVAALRRIEEGTFGTCEGCGEGIAMARIEAVPYASFCIDCERERERNG
jgi:DnaK suppressor protein